MSLLFLFNQQQAISAGSFISFGSCRTTEISIGTNQIININISDLLLTRVTLANDYISKIKTSDTKLSNIVISEV
jgi:hypothetical protein